MGGAETTMEENATVRRSWWRRPLRIVNSLVWVIVALIIIPQACGTYWTDRARTKLLERFQGERKSRVIAMIHRQETVSVLGVPVSNFIDIEDSEEILRAIRATPNDQPIDLILHTPGGLVLAAEQIARALVEHKGKITVFVPHYAMSGGTLIALAADEIVMAAKARIQVAAFVAGILLKHYPKKQAAEIATILSEGRWTHDFPIMVDGALQLGLKVSTNMPRMVYDLMDLYPQAGTGRPSVLYVPLHRPSKDQGEAPRATPTAPTSWLEQIDRRS